MKNRILLVALTMTLTVAAQATIVTSWNSGNLNGVTGIAITDGNPAGVTFNHTISQGDVVSGVALSGFNPVQGDISVRLNVSGGFNGDLYGYLVLDNGPGNTATAILLNRIGQDNDHPFGSSGSGFNVTLSDAGTVNGSIHNAGGGATGTWLADGSTLDSTFSGLSANGTWTLFLADLSGGSTSSLLSWGLDVTVVPEPVTWAMIIFAGALALVKLAQWRFGRKTA
jgi:subtilisin-like proprotein convertase family protein